MIPSEYTACEAGSNNLFTSCAHTFLEILRFLVTSNLTTYSLHTEKPVVLAARLPLAVSSLLASDSVVEVVVDSVEEVPDSVELVADSVDLLVDSVLEVADSVEHVADSVEEVPDSIEVVPDADVVVQCGLCKTYHAGGISGEACREARREALRCARCGLVHEEYNMAARLFHAMDKFDCHTYIPDVDKLEMRGNTIILPEQVIKKLQEHVDKMRESKINPQANEEDEGSKDH
ncbi:hypothetical protein SORBI_3007G087500 [Sorghum bicolor]|uniref:Uncharacterized protein n=1 Tax=Sorghum bicolor TaxID=4558 RepID=A0A1B6PGQ3_SORBI|nr:hypothetical protein SORBI_3007G087500 [Sorghum bicolor]